MMTGSQDSETEAAKPRSHTASHAWHFMSQNESKGQSGFLRREIQTPPLDGKSGMNLQEWKG